MNAQGTAKRKQAGLVLVIVLISFLLPAFAMAGARPTAIVPGWMRSNDSGFGDPANYGIGALDEFDGQLYAGTWNSVGGAQLWRTPDGSNWSPITPTWSLSNTEIYDLAPFMGQLYIGMGGGQGGEIWRGDGTAWEQVVAGGFGDDNNYAISAMAEFSGSLYAATANLPPPYGSGNGVEVWRSDSGDAGSWVQVNEDGFGGGPTWTDFVMDVYQGHLYLGLGRVAGGGTESLAELWRTDGLSWTAVFTDGLGDAGNSHVAAMAEFQGELYIGLRNITTGGQVWRSGDGLAWTPVFTDGLGDPARSRPYGLIVHDGRLVVVFSRPGGAEVWQSSDGQAWQQIAAGGWGNANNMMAGYFDKPLAHFRGDLYIGTLNMVDGGEIWRRLHVVYLPLIARGQSAGR